MSYTDPIIFILSYNRPDRVKTLKLLKRLKTTFPIVLVISEDDPQYKNYFKLHPKETFLTFKKEDVNVDTMDNFNTMNVPLYARCFIEEYTNQKGIKKYIVLDDDYSEFSYRFNYNNQCKQIHISDIDKIFNLFLDYNKIPSIIPTFSQNGDYIGGIGSTVMTKGYKFKIMNVFFGNDTTKIPFKGTLNEDLNASLILANRGIIPLTIGGISLNQEDTQSTAGGLTNAYLDLGTYVKSFYSVMINPSAVSIRLMGGGDSISKQTHLRMHHHTKQNNIYPRIISEQYKKT